MSPFRRRRFFIHPIQKRYAFLTAILLIAYTFLIVLTLFIPPAVTLISGSPIEKKAQAAMQYIILGERLWPAIAISISVLAVISVYITHKLAGPIYRFEKTAKDVIGGDLSVRIRLRKGDDLKELANLLNQLLGNIDKSLMNIRRMEGDMGADLPGILKDLSGLEGLNSRQELIERMEMVIERNKEVRDILDRFKLSDKNEEKR